MRTTIKNYVLSSLAFVLLVTAGVSTAVAQVPDPGTPGSLP